MLSNPLVRIMLAQVKPNGVTPAMLGNLLNILGHRMDTDSVRALSTAINHTEGYATMLDLLESEHAQALFGMVGGAPRRGDKPLSVDDDFAVICPKCSAAFELGAGSKSL